jgi:hypothetical protein
MLGFKRFETAAVTIPGIELAEKIKKHQTLTGEVAAQYFSGTKRRFANEVMSS